MEVNNIISEKREPKVQISFNSIKQVLLKHKRDYFIALSATFIITCIITLSLHNYYECEVTLVPEEAKQNNSSGVLSSLASSFGFNLGNNTSGTDALGPSLYPKLMSSTNFIIDLFPIQVLQDENGASMTYYHYLKDNQKSPWWGKALKALFRSIGSLFGRDKGEQQEIVNPFQLTKDQMDIVKTIREKIRCESDKENSVISIKVMDQSPLVAATMADSVKNHLQEAITAYRTSKARVDLDYNKKIYAEVKARYDEAKQKYADYYDANKRIFTQKAKNQLTDLQNEMELQYQAYTSVAAQLQAAEAKVQEDTPAFTIIQGATIPLLKAGPRRSIIVLSFCFLVFLCVTIHILHKERYLRPIVVSLLGLEG